VVHVEVDHRDALDAMLVSACIAPTATLLNRQKPIARWRSAWWPGGRTAQNALVQCRPRRGRCEHSAPAACSAARQRCGHIAVSGSM
jgi:hypothetical protein